MDLAQKFLSYNRIAVVGASRNPEKYGNQIYFNLKNKGYEVYAINPRISEIEGDLCYPNLSSLPVKVDVVNFVVPPNVGREVVTECLNLGIKTLWFQPGAESQELIEFCESKGLQVLHNQCVMVLSKSRSEST